MAERSRVIDLFCEDSGHEVFCRALIRRLARDARMRPPHVRTRAARGGHGKAVSELRFWQANRPDAPGDLLVVVIDANGEGAASQRRNVEAAIQASAHAQYVVGCPDPHVEAWAAADLEALREVIGAHIAPPGSSTSDFKAWLRHVLDAAGVPVLNEPMDLSRELVDRMDLFAAGKASPSLKHFMDGLRAALARLASDP